MTQGRRDIGTSSPLGRSLVTGTQSHIGYSLISRLVRQTAAETFVADLTRAEYLDTPPKIDMIFFGSNL